jgi:hypothetical protein
MQPQDNQGASQPPSGRPPSGRRGRPRGAAGVVLIVIGVVALIATLSRNEQIGLLFLPALGLIFLIWGIVVRNPGLLVPGGVLTGLGVGVLLAQDVFKTSDQQSGAVILISMGVGFLIITPLSLLVARRRQYWALVPGAILLLIGAAILVGGVALQVVQDIGMFWPLILIAAGVYVLWRAGFRRRKDDSVPGAS